jgi:hypothetical protein
VLAPTEGLGGAALVGGVLQVLTYLLFLVVYLPYYILRKHVCDLICKTVLFVVMQFIKNGLKSALIWCVGFRVGCNDSGPEFL